MKLTFFISLNSPCVHFLFQKGFIFYDLFQDKIAYENKLHKITGKIGYFIFLIVGLKFNVKFDRNIYFHKFAEHKRYPRIMKVYLNFVVRYGNFWN